MLIFCFGFAAAAAAVNTAKSLWQVPGVRSFVAALEAGSSAVDLNTQPPSHFNDQTKADWGENRARRKLAAELRQSKASASSIKALQQPGRRI